MLIVCARKLVLRTTGCETARTPACFSLCLCSSVHMGTKKCHYCCEMIRFCRAQLGTGYLFIMKPRQLLHYVVL